MTTLTLTLLPDGKGILAVSKDCSDSELYELRQAFEAWRKSSDGVLFFAGTVEHATSIEIDLPPVPVLGAAS